MMFQIGVGPKLGAYGALSAVLVPKGAGHACGSASDNDYVSFHLGMVDIGDRGSEDHGVLRLHKLRRLHRLRRLFTTKLSLRPV